MNKKVIAVVFVSVVLLGFIVYLKSLPQKNESEDKAHFSNSKEVKKINIEKKKHKKIIKRVPSDIKNVNKINTNDRKKNYKKNSVGLKGNDALEEKTLRKYPFLADGKILQDVSYDENNEDGIKNIKILEADFKYPFIRVVEREGVNKKGERYVYNEVMVADHVLVKLKDEALEDDFRLFVSDIGGRLSSPREYSRIYRVNFDISDIKGNDKFLEIYEKLKESNYTKTTSADYLVSIY